MNWSQVQGNWKQFKGRAQTYWGQLTDSDLDRINGEKEVLIGRLQELYGLSREKAESEIRHFLDTCHPHC